MNTQPLVNSQAGVTQFPILNRADAERFLAILDEDTDRFTFQTFDDDKDRKDGRLARTLHGTLYEHFPTLVNLNRLGAGGFITINATNLQKRAKECIVKVRGYFADLDGAPLENLGRLSLRPHVVWETSPRRYQALYLVSDAPLNGEYFKERQQTLAHLIGSDPSVCDLPRVLRLPGFLHQKDPSNPFLARIIEDNDQTPVYTNAEFQQALTNAGTAHPSTIAPRRSLSENIAAGLRSIGRRVMQKGSAISNSPSAPALVSAVEWT
jgi:hypothetical protein